MGFGKKGSRFHLPGRKAESPRKQWPGPDSCCCNYLCGHTAQDVLSQDMKYLGSHAALLLPACPQQN